MNCIAKQFIKTSSPFKRGNAFTGFILLTVQIDCFVYDEKDVTYCF